MADACVTAENYIIRRMIFRLWSVMRMAPVARAATDVAMVDPRPGNALVVIGASNPRLAAACAVVTGLNGRTVIVGRGDADKKNAESAAAAAGALIEFVDAPLAMLPLDADVFDVVVIPRLTDAASAADTGVIGEAFRVARPAGRVIVLTGQKRAGVFGALQAPQTAPTADAVIALLKSAGGVAVRKLASHDGVSYFEARKPR